eukprot:RCo047879
METLPWLLLCMAVLWAFWERRGSFRCQPCPRCPPTGSHGFAREEDQRMEPMVLHPGSGPALVVGAAFLTHRNDLQRGRRDFLPVATLQQWLRGLSRSDIEGFLLHTAGAVSSLSFRPPKVTFVPVNITSANLRAAGNDLRFPLWLQHLQAQRAR